ncbi:MAG TPA: STAS/SEC14 domain-containing protein [Rhodanobacteraceae bacterium]|nr:STAS/SEC14 domain-containing protein [Rhodanobacteraceae bacterium]
MIETMQGLPDGVLGFIARGKVTSVEYRTIKTPRIEAAFAQHRKLRVLWLMGNDFRGFEFGAVWQDLTLGLRHWRGWECIALVTDTPWLRGIAFAFGFLIPGEFRLFPLCELDSAKHWISEGL